MHRYDFRCNDTGKKFEVHFKTYAEYDPSQVRSPFTGSSNVTRLIGKIAIKKGGSLSSLMDGDESALDDLENADPATLGRALREMADETGEDMGAEFGDIVERLESGQSPEEIEASLPAAPDDDGLV